MTEIVTVALAGIDTGKRLRSLDRNWVLTLAEQISANGLQSPIEVVGIGDRYRLVFGAHRLEAVKHLGWTGIPAVVKSSADVGRDFDERLREIAENLVRRELSVLDHAVNVATWRGIYNAINPVPKRGRRSKDEAQLEISARFCTNFSDAAQKAMAISRRAVFHALKIASIDPAVRDTIALHAAADNQSELLLLAGESFERQQRIAHCLTHGPAPLQSVAEAIAFIDKLPPPVALEPHERLSSDFARLKADQQHRFFDLHADAIELWLAKRGK